MVSPLLWLTFLCLSNFRTFSCLILFAFLFEHYFFRLNCLISSTNSCQWSQTRAWSFWTYRQVLHSCLIHFSFVVLRCWTDSLVSCCRVCCARSRLLFFVGGRSALFLLKFDLLNFNYGLAFLLRWYAVNLIHQVCILLKAARWFFFLSKQTIIVIIQVADVFVLLHVILVLHSVVLLFLVQLIWILKFFL